MADETKKINIIVTLQDKASKDMKKLEKSGINMGQTLASAGQIAATAMLAVGTSIATAGAFSLRNAVKLEQTSVALTTMTGSADKAKKLLGDIAQTAKTTPFELQELTDASKLLLAFGEKSENVVKTMRMLGDVAAGVSAPVGEVALVFGQIRAQQQAYTQDLRQFASRGIPIYEQLADQMGITVEMLKRGMDTGKIKVSANDIEKAFQSMTSENGKFFEMMDRQSKTAGGIISNLKDEFYLMSLQIAGIDPDGTIQPGGLFDQFKTILQDLLKMVNENKGAIIAFVQNGMNQLINTVQNTIKYFQDLHKFYTENKTLIDILVIGLGIFIGVIIALNVALGIATAVTTAFGVAMAIITSPITLVILAIAAVIAIIVLLIMNWGKVKEFMINAGNAIKDAVVKAFTDLWNFILGIGQKFREALNNMITINGIGFGDYIVLTIQKAILGFQILFAKASQIFQMLKDRLTQFWQGVAQVAINIKNRIVEAFVGIRNSIANVFNGIKENIMKLVRQAINPIIDKFNSTFEFKANVAGVEVGFDLPDIPKFAKGGDFIVPPGFNNDSFPMMVESGERVQVTPANQVAQGNTGGSGNTFNIYNYGNKLNENAIASKLAFQLS